MSRFPWRSEKHFAQWCWGELHFFVSIVFCVSVSSCPASTPDVVIGFRERTIPCKIFTCAYMCIQFLDWRESQIVKLGMFSALLPAIKRGAFQILGGENTIKTFTDLAPSCGVVAPHKHTCDTEPGGFYCYKGAWQRIFSSTFALGIQLLQGRATFTTRFIWLYRLPSSHIQ